MKIRKENVAGANYFTLANDCGLEVTLCDYGAAVYEIRYDGHPMSVGPLDKKTFLHCDYYGKTVGRLSGRVKQGKLSFNGKVYQMPQNEGDTCLHSGPGCLSFQHFESELTDKGILFSYFSIGGESGLPGNVHVKVIYELEPNEPVFSMRYECQSDIDTPIGLLNHNYYNLGGEPTILEHTLQIDASKVATLDDEMVPVGFENVDDITDFRKPKLIGRDVRNPVLINHRVNGYDHIYLLDGKPGKAILEGPEYGLEAISEAPCLVCYSTNYPLPSLKMNNGQMNRMYSGLTLEFGELPNTYALCSAKDGFSRSTHLRFYKKDRRE